MRALLLVWDERYALVTVVIAAFGRAVSEVGAVMIVGGNIDGFTRVMTTAIALETSKGDLPLALALGHRAAGRGAAAQLRDLGGARLARAHRRRRGRCGSGAAGGGAVVSDVLFSLHEIDVHFGRVPALVRVDAVASMPASAWR